MYPCTMLRADPGGSLPHNSSTKRVTGTVSFAKHASTPSR
jgi:hypothetical protein